jgi:hypothetical protein
LLTVSARIALTLAFIALLVVPAAAQTISDDATLLLSCGVIFSLKGSDAQAAGDPGAANEWLHRGDELTSRARLMLADAGFTPDKVEDIVNNNSLVTGFSIGVGAPPFTDDQCLALTE